MIGHIIEMEMDYINTSHPNFIGGSKAVEIAQQQIKPSKVSFAMPRQKDGIEPEKAPASEKSMKSPWFSGQTSNKNVSSWGISSIFGGGDHSRMSAKENSLKIHSEHESIEIVVTKLLLRSYYDIVRKNIEDSIPKAIMHFLVNHTKRELHNVFIRKLYRENLFEEMLQEPDEIAMKRKHTREQLRVLQQAFRTLDELPLEAETVERGYSLSSDSTGLPKIHGLPTSTMYSSGSSDSYSASPKNPKSRKSSHSGELQPHLYADSNGSGRASMPDY
ncbi:hypothetical protein OIU77_002895 [Salix suchowensis]|uniref:GED domain-containing protein n=1 Tax=Salix suchowensis TaxID=1278906 RepID=A0ABQ9AXU7_9ROSI|nr:hypothetical protein OIU77_002895 [Salix suchowensis]